MQTKELDSRYWDLVALSFRAGDIALEMWQNCGDVMFKPDKSRVTKADLRLNKMILEGIEKAFPEDQKVGEENFDASKINSLGRIWYVDPIDGTDAYIEGRNEWVIHIGLADKGKAYFGIVYHPCSGDLFLGGVDVPFMLVKKDNPKELLLPQQTSLDLFRIVDSVHRPNALVKEIKAKTEGVDVVQVSSMGLKLVGIALGLYDLYVSTGACSVWDTCAPEAILRAENLYCWKNGEERMIHYHPEEKNTAKIGHPFFVINKEKRADIFDALVSSGYFK